MRDPNVQVSFCETVHASTVVEHYTLSYKLVIPDWLICVGTWICCNLPLALLQVINLMEKEGIEWSEENRGTVIIKLGGQRDFRFVDSDTEYE